MAALRNIKLLLAYDGTDFSGWQRQQNIRTVQETLETGLAVITAEKVTVHGAGRTDAGVHALGMVANFNTSAKIPCTGLQKGLNSLLPEDVRILAAADAAPDFHARRSATGKTYYYDCVISPVQMPTKRLYALHLPAPPDLESIQACLPLLLGTHDFSSFEATGSRDHEIDSSRGAVRTLLEARLDTSGLPGRLRLYVTGDGFLRHMVRNIVGTLLAVGRHKFTPEQFAGIIQAKNRSLAGPTAPARGLFLKEIYYGAAPGSRLT